MVQITDSQGTVQYSISTELHTFLMRCQQKIMEEDSMVLGILWGGVGCGKSVTAQHWGYVIDKTLENNISRVCFDKQEFIDAVKTCRKQVIIADEGISLFFSRASMTKDGRLISELMAQIRQKNLIVLVCVPDLLSMDGMLLNMANFVAYVWETNFKVHDKNVLFKGNVELYPELKGVEHYKTKIVEYLKKKKRTPLKFLYKPEPFLIEKGNPMGETYSPAWYPCGEEEYKMKKEEILNKYKSTDEKVSKPKVTRKEEDMKELQELVYQELQKNPNLSTWKLAIMLNRTREKVAKARYSLENKGVIGDFGTSIISSFGTVRSSEELKRLERVK